MQCLHASSAVLVFAVLLTPPTGVLAAEVTLSETSLSLPDGGQVVLREGDLYRSAGPDQGLEQITFSGGRLTDPALAVDGRLLVTLDGRRMAVQPDGTWMMPLVGEEPAVASDGRADLLPSIVKPEMTSAYVVVFDLARSDDPALRGLERDAVAALRVLLREDGESRVLAEAAPAEDGSVYLEVPADRTLGFELVSRDGSVLARMDTPFWTRPNERRACLGCHVDPRYAPPNVHLRALDGEPLVVSAAEDEP